MHALRPISADPEAHAEIIAALIDGLYLRAALSQSKPADAARDLALHTLNTLLEERK
jgi:TetR/AcrR family transcriptional repressor of bet genes